MQRRKEHGFTQEQLSEQIGISKNHLSSIERGLYVPTIQLIFKICSILGGTPDYYLIGKISEDAGEAVQLLQRMPADAQKITLRLIEAYLNALEEI
jgi:transcriptional regulator with XRE-family HTH domain